MLRAALRLSFIATVLTVLVTGRGGKRRASAPAATGAPGRSRQSGARTLGAYLTALIGAIVLLIIFWAIVHWLAEPGKEISFLRGVVSYTKRHVRARTRKMAKPINVIDEYTGLLWRIVDPVKNWIDSDIKSFRAETISRILNGPFHEKCKMDLSYLDSSERMSRWCVRRTCIDCDVEILPESVTNDRTGIKTFVLQRLQQLHLQGTKIKNGMTI